MELQKSAKSQNKIKGAIGETSVSIYLENEGYIIIENNYKNKIGEIDIIAKDQSERIIFIEVKARATAKFGYPREAVTKTKQNKIKLVAQTYLKLKGQTNAYIRFDVLEVLNGKITHIKNAF